MNYSLANCAIGMTWRRLDPNIDKLVCSTDFELTFFCICLKFKNIGIHFRG